MINTKFSYRQVSNFLAFYLVFKESGFAMEILNRILIEAITYYMQKELGKTMKYMG